MADTPQPPPQKLDWATIAGLLLQYGLPFVDKLIAKWSVKGEVTQAEWDDLKSLAVNTARSQMIDALNRAGIPMDDPKAIALLAQVPKLPGE